MKDSMQKGSSFSTKNEAQERKSSLLYMARASSLDLNSVPRIILALCLRPLILPFFTCFTIPVRRQPFLSLSRLTGHICHWGK